MFIKHIQLCSTQYTPRHLSPCPNLSGVAMDTDTDVIDLPQAPLHPPPPPPPHISYSTSAFPPSPGNTGDLFVLAASIQSLAFSVPSCRNFNASLYETCTTTYSSSLSPSFHNSTQQASFQTSLAPDLLNGRNSSNDHSIFIPTAAGGLVYQFNDSHLPYSLPSTSLYHHITRTIYSASGHTTNTTITGTYTKADSMDVYVPNEPLSLVPDGGGGGGGTSGASASAMASISHSLLSTLSTTLTTTTTSITKAIDIALANSTSDKFEFSQLEMMFQTKPTLFLSTTTASSLGAGWPNTPPLSPLSQPQQTSTTGSTAVHAEDHTEQEKKKKNVFSYMEDFFLEKVLPEFKRRQGRMYSYRYKSSVAVKETTSTATTAPETSALAQLTIHKNKAPIPSFLRRCRKTPPSISPPQQHHNPLLPTLHASKSHLPISRSKITKKICPPFTWRRPTRASLNHKQACTTWEVDIENDVIMCDGCGRTDSAVDCLQEEMDIDCDMMLEEI